MTAAKVRLAMGQKETKVADLCSELGIIRQTHYRHLAPNGGLRKDGQKVVEGGPVRTRRVMPISALRSIATQSPTLLPSAQMGPTSMGPRRLPCVLCSSFVSTCAPPRRA